MDLVLSILFAFFVLSFLVHYAPSISGSRELSLVSLETDKTYTLSEFMSLQAEQCSHVSEGLVLLRDKVIDVLLSALRVSMPSPPSKVWELVHQIERVKNGNVLWQYGEGHSVCS